MATTERRQDEGVRELRLEGAVLVLFAAVALAVIAGAFMAGRWYERRQAGGSPASAEFVTDPLANVAGEKAPLDVESDADYFDRLEGGEKQLEPARETGQPKTAAEQAPSDEPRRETAPAPVPEPAARPSTGGAFWVQVFAGRDRGSADGLVARLREGGYDVRLVAEPEGRGSLYKVRVEGFGDREAARAAAQKLQREGYAGAWVGSGD